MNTVETFSGRIVDPLNLKVEDIHIVDIARPLERICRYGGHVKEHYSVAQHCVHVATMARGNPNRIRQALLHDAAEAYLGDMVSPLKEQLEVFRMAEAKALDVIHEALGVEIVPEDQELIRHLDQVARHLEMRDLGFQTGPPLPIDAVKYGARYKMSESWKFSWLETFLLTEV